MDEAEDRTIQRASALNRADEIISTVPVAPTTPSEVRWAPPPAPTPESVKGPSTVGKGAAREGSFLDRQGGRLAVAVAVVSVSVGALLAWKLVNDNGDSSASDPSIASTNPVNETSTVEPITSTTEELAPTTAIEPPSSTLAEATTVPIATPSIADLPLSGSTTFAGPGAILATSEVSPAGVPVGEYGPAATRIQQYLDALSAGDAVTAQQIAPSQQHDEATMALFAPIDRYSSVVLDARRDRAGFHLLAIGVANLSDVTTSVRCFVWWSDGSSVERTTGVDIVIDGPYPIQFGAESLRLDAEFTAKLAALCRWPF